LKEDFEILKKLGFVLALQKKYKDSIRVYKEAYEKRKNDPGIIDILCDLTYEVEDYNSTIKFTKKFLADKPRDVEKMYLQAHSYDHL
jgi:tetratricopeptide (TPR) repeat protein